MQELQTGQAKTFEGIPALTFIDKENYNPITRIFGYEQKPAENHTPENRSRQKATGKIPYQVLLAEDDKEMRTTAGTHLAQCRL